MSNDNVEGSFPRFSVIVPVYNREDEVRDLLESLRDQSVHNFEVVLVEDGSTLPCSSVAKEFDSPVMPVRYFFKENEGRSIARNYGMERAAGQWLVFFDSDCVIPPDYFRDLEENLRVKPCSFYGGPDAAHSSFSKTQKAINYTMTAFLTTGGIRGGKVSMEKFTPRTFNMGFSREVYSRVGGFREMFSEDIDMSTRIARAGFPAMLYPELAVWHKRRLSWKKFWRQVHIFGMSRITLKLLYPGSLKLVHTLPALAVVGALLLIALGIFISPWWLVPFVVYLLAIFITGLVATHSLAVAVRVPLAAVIQIVGYGTGFIRAYVWKILLRQGRDQDQEIRLRKGK